MLSKAALKDLRHIKGTFHDRSEWQEAQSPQAATALFHRGLVDRMRQGDYDQLTQKWRRFFIYKLTPAGRKALEADDA